MTLEGFRAPFGDKPTTRAAPSCTGALLLLQRETRVASFEDDDDALTKAHVPEI